MYHHTPIFTALFLRKSLVRRCTYDGWYFSRLSERVTRWTFSLTRQVIFCLSNLFLFDSKLHILSHSPHPVPTLPTCACSWGRSFLIVNPKIPRVNIQEGESRHLLCLIVVERIALLNFPFFQKIIKVVRENLKQSERSHVLDWVL